jgi:hypothetical protein
LGHYNTAHRIIQTQDGGYAIIGMYGSQNPLNATLVKYDANGNMSWYQSYELQFINYPMNTALLQTKDSGFAIIGNKYQTLNLTLVKTDLKGTIQWSKSYTNDILAWGMTQTSDDGYFIAGTTSYVTTGTHTKAALLKIDASGNLQWKKTGGACAIVQDEKGNYIAAGGDRITKVDISGNTLWDKELPPVLPSDPEHYRWSANYIQAMTKTNDSGYALAGHTFNKNNSGEEASAAVLIKTDSSGAILWNKTYGADRQTWVFSIVQTSDNGYALAGMAHTLPNSNLNDFSQTDMVLIKTDEYGNEQWTQTFGGNQSTDIAVSIIETRDGGFALAGMTKPGTTFSEGYYYIVKTTPVLSNSSAAFSTTETPVFSIEIFTVIVTILIVTIICIVILALDKFNRVYSKK